MRTTKQNQKKKKKNPWKVVVVVVVELLILKCLLALFRLHKSTIIILINCTIIYAFEHFASQQVFKHFLPSFTITTMYVLHRSLFFLNKSNSICFKIKIK
jgi:hypothetical protein